MPEVPAPDADTTTRTITDGYFEEELYVDADSLGAFLIELGKQFQSSDEIKITGDGWEIPFAYGEPIELDIEFEGDGEPELEIELELKGHSKDKAPSIG